MGSLQADDFTAQWAAHDLGDVVVSAKEVRDRVRELGRQITQDYAQNPPLLVCVLKGAINFMSDLMRAIELPVEVDFMAVSSYGAATKTSGVVRIVKDLDVDLALLLKEGEQRVEQELKYVGFTIDSHFVVGYGLDVNERYRNLDAIYTFTGQA